MTEVMFCDFWVQDIKMPYTCFHFVFLRHLLVELSHHMMRKLKQQLEGPSWRRIKLIVSQPWLSFQLKASINLAATEWVILKGAPLASNWASQLMLGRTETNYLYKALSKFQIHDQNRYLYCFKPIILLFSDRWQMYWDSIFLELVIFSVQENNFKSYQIPSHFEAIAI